MNIYRIVQPENRKGRTFHATCAALVVSNLFDEFSANDVRPIFAAFVGNFKVG